MIKCLTFLNSWKSTMMTNNWWTIYWTLVIMTKTNDCNIKSNEMNSIKITNNIIFTKRNSTMSSMWYKNIIEKTLTSRDLDETLRRSWFDSKNFPIVFYNNVNIVTHWEKIMLRKYFDLLLHEFEHLINFWIFEFEFWIWRLTTSFYHSNFVSCFFSSQLLIF